MTKTNFGVSREFRESETQKHHPFQLGDIVSTTAHPYLSIPVSNDGEGKRSESSVKERWLEIKISAYNHLTPPLMVVTEVKIGKKFDKEFGKKRISFKCLFYSSNQGTFEEYWFREDEIKLVRSGTNKLYHDNKDFDIIKLKEDLIGKQAIMTTVDLELGKVSVYRDSDPVKRRSREKNILDFLPPLGTIIQVLVVGSHIEYDENTGEPDFEKSRIKVKLRWYNNKSGKFSEIEIPLVALKLVEGMDVKEDFKKDEIYLFPKRIELEGLDLPVIAKIPVRFQSLVFNHYYYKYEVRNLFTNNLEILRTDADNIKLLEPSDLHNILNTPSFIEKNIDSNPEKNSEDDRFSTKKNVEEWEGKWVKITYADRVGRYTTRIIYCRKILDIASDGFSIQEKLLVGNCLLRNGAIRHFRKEGILAFQVLPESFSENFEEDV